MKLERPEHLTVSLCLIVRDEADSLPVCLNSVQHLVSEIIVVDTGSWDKTVEVAQQFGARVYPIPWSNHFADVRNFALTQAHGDWILILDADEELEWVDAENWRKFLQSAELEGYYLRIKNYLGQGHSLSWDEAVRLFKNKPAYRFSGRIHEQIAPSLLTASSAESIGHAPWVIRHYGYLDSRITAKNKSERNIKLLRQALAEEPADPFPAYCLGLEYLQKDQAGEAVVVLEQALHRLKGSEGYLKDFLVHLGLAYLRLGRYQKLLSYTQQALEMFPQESDLLSLLALALSNLGRTAEAEQAKNLSLSLGTSRFGRAGGPETPFLPSNGLVPRPPRVLLGSPVKQKANILSFFLEGIKSLDLTGLDLDMAFIDDNNNHDLLKQFAAHYEQIRILPASTSAPEPTYICDEHTHHWQEDLIWRVAGYKNQLLDLAKAENYDYLFLVDSDLVLQPPTLRHLLSLNKDIVSEVFWTSWQPNLPPLPQVWLKDQYQLYAASRGESLAPLVLEQRIEEFLAKLRQPGTYPVGGLGACTLISRRALAAGVSFNEIPNLGFQGEDRHFCIRAAALGINLYADTHYPPLHLYRESDLAGLSGRIKAWLPADAQKHGPRIKSFRAEEKPARSTAEAGRHFKGITLMMLMRNEAGRYLERVLRQARFYIDQAVILDDASDDASAAVCRNILEGIPLILHTNQQTGFADESRLRRQLWELAAATEPEWLLALDADEVWEDGAPVQLRRLIQNPAIDYYSFRLYDMWSESAYREDTYWQAHKTYRPLLMRYHPDYGYIWRDTPQHCGRLPLNLTSGRGELSNIRLKHLGWLRPEDRLAKYYRYRRLDPEARYGIAGQYTSILEPLPKLIPWEQG